MLSDETVEPLLNRLVGAMPDALLRCYDIESMGSSRSLMTRDKEAEPCSIASKTMNS